MSARPPSLQARLLSLVLALVASVWLAAALVTWFDTRHELDELLDGHLAQAAALLVAQQAQGMDHDGDTIDAPTLHRYGPKVMFQVFHEGQLTLRSANAPVAPMVGPNALAAGSFGTVAVGGAQWRVFAAAGAERDIQVFVAEQTSSRTSIMWAVLRGALWPMLAALPLLALATWWAVCHGMAPLRRLGDSIGQRAPAATEPLDMHGISREMVPMVEALNRLFSQIGALLEAERRFTADAAHELRTPIAAIRTQAQVARAESDDAQRQHALDATIAGCDRATRVVEQLLTLARLEGGTLPDMATVDVAMLVQQVMADMAPRAIAGKQAMELDAEPDCVQVANATLLSLMVRNLLDNAIRYCPPGSRIVLGVRHEGGKVLVLIDDSGPGLNDAQLQRLGERFFRADDSGASGSGLGWSIVRRIAEVHGLQLTVRRSEKLGGLSVRLQF